MRKNPHAMVIEKCIYPDQQGSDFSFSEHVEGQLDAICIACAKQYEFAASRLRCHEHLVLLPLASGPVGIDESADKPGVRSKLGQQLKALRLKVDGQARVAREVAAGTV